MSLIYGWVVMNLTSTSVKNQGEKTNGVGWFFDVLKGFEIEDLSGKT
jgi:hypothetical protein